MVTESDTKNSLEQLDAILAQHAFGNTEYITKQLHICLKRRLDKISDRLPVARQLLDAVCQSEAYMQYRVFGDTVVRCAIQHGLRQIETGVPYGIPLEQCEEVFEETTRLIYEGKSGPLGSQLENRIGPDSHHAYIWSEEHSNDVFGRAFRFVVQDNYAEKLCTPSAAEVAMLAKGTRLLNELLPLSSRSALSHAHFVGIFPQVGTWVSRASSSEFRLCGTVFLSCKLLNNPWWVAEHLFHESLHQQLYDFRHGHSLLEPNFDREGAPTIHSLWNVPDQSRGNHWDIHRALAAFHVYVYLTLLATIAEQRAQELEDEYGPLTIVTNSQTAFVRAYYLGEQIRALCWNELGEAGKRVVDWFSSVLEILNPSPPPQGSYLHLILDRYWKEAKDFGLRLSKMERPIELSTQLMLLAEDEVKSVRSVLAELNAESALSQFEQDLAFLSDEAPTAQFVSVRKLIAKTILMASPNGYSLSETRLPDEIVMQMVERSSENLMHFSV